MVENQVLSVWEVLVDKFPQQAQTPRHYLARALGLKMAEIDALLKPPASADALLRVHTRAVYRYLALVNRVWPHCPWWEDRMSARSLHPVLHLWSQALGHDLLGYVEQHFWSGQSTRVLAESGGAGCVSRFSSGPRNGRPTGRYS